jgi:NADH dehydrogenase
LEYGLVRPTVIYGREDVLLNNIAWGLRRFPIFPVPSGDYRVQPVSVEDVADIMVEAGHASENVEWDAAGPDIMRYIDMVRMVREAVGSKSRIIVMPGTLAYWLGRLLDLGLRDVTLTRDEVTGLTASLLVTSTPPRGRIRLQDWLRDNAQHLGTAYVSETKKHFDKVTG